MKLIKSVLLTCILTLMCCSTAFAYTTWDISGNYYDSIDAYQLYTGNNSTMFRAYETYGTCNLYVTRGKSVTIRITPQLGSDSGRQSVIFLNGPDGFKSAASASGYGSSGWNYTFTYDDTQQTIYLRLGDSGFGTYVNRYYKGVYGYSSAFLWNNSGHHVTINVRQNPSEQSSIGDEEIL